MFAAPIAPQVPQSEGLSTLGEEPARFWGEVFGPGTEWNSVGLVMAIVGAFLLANAILFRHPRALVEEHFSGRRRHLTTIRDYIFHRVNIHLGFLFLLCGFTLQLYGDLQPAPPGPREFPTAWVGAILLLALGLEVAGWWWSNRLFRRYVRAYLVENPGELAIEGRLAREVGQLFAIPAEPEDTVESYLARLCVRLGLPQSALESARADRGVSLPGQEGPRYGRSAKKGRKKSSKPGAESDPLQDF